VTAGTGVQPEYVFTAENQIDQTGPPAVTYDAAGNMTDDGLGLGNAYTYDAENRIITAANGYTASYVYDAFGHRVRAVVNGVNRDFLYDLSGRTIDQLTSGTLTRTEAYAGGMHVATYVNSTTEFDNSDWLSTVRVRSDVAGNKIETCTSLPFGEDLTCTGTEDSPLHFTGKEHDWESGNDFFGARYYGETMGRFMRPDPDQAAGFDHMEDPQAWNGYAYVRNNPLRYADKDGENYTVCDTNGKNCADLNEDQYKQYLQSLQGTNTTVNSAGQIQHTNDNGSVTNLGTATYYNEKDVQAAQQVVATQGLILNLGARMYIGGITGGAFGWAAGEFIGGVAEGLSAANTAKTAATVELTSHAAIRLAQRGITQAAVNEAVETAQAAGQVTTKIGQYGTPQNIYQGANGITVIVETQGSNAGKVITAFQTGSKP
jgi:RHS repeat-associated protein